MSVADKYNKKILYLYKQETAATMESAVLLEIGGNIMNNCPSTGFEINDRTKED